MAFKTAEEILKEIINIEVDEYSTPCSITADDSSSFDEVVKMMNDGGVRHVPVLKNGRPVGIISDRDIRNIPSGSPLLAYQLMSEDPLMVTAGTLLRDVVFEMSTKKIGSALVHNEETDELFIFTSVDALNALNEILRGESLS